MIKIMAVIDPVFRRVVFIFSSLLIDKFDKNYSSINIIIGKTALRVNHEMIRKLPLKIML
jgi:hypothetical protein